MTSRSTCLARQLRRIAATGFWLFLSLTSGAVAAPADPAGTSFRPAQEGYRYEFPRDHGSHDTFRTEWWYYTGHLETAEGRRFGFELTFFRRGIEPDQIETRPSRWSVDQLYLAHLAITDVTGRRFHFHDRISRAGLGKAGADATHLNVWLDQWRAESPEQSEQHRLNAKADGVALALTLEPTKPLVIHGEHGISKKGAAAGQASHYYSFTRLKTGGTLTLGTETFRVTGTSWMDHEFGSADLSPELVGWDWFSIHLSDNRELMVYRLRLADGTSDPASSGTLVEADGRTQHLSASDIELTPLTSWTSPASKATYPQQWRVTIPSLNLSLELTPLLADQELRTSRSTQVTYWEGAVDAIGTERDQPIRGKGYIELTGYAERIKQKL
ncbi:MAG: AttH component of AttEFGH ABC transport system [Nitrospira sp.]|nr:MAG: AttH component of AttEFGH ABC transport system [Nitrospira sp.]